MPRQRSGDQDVEGETGRRAEGEERHRAEMREGGLDDQQRAREPHRAGAQTARADMFAQDQFADQEDDEGFDKGDGQRIGHRHHPEGGDEAVGRQDRYHGAQAGEPQSPRRHVERQAHDPDNRQHQGRLNDEAGQGHHPHRHFLCGKFRGDVDQWCDHAKADHQRHAGQDAVGMGHGAWASLGRWPRPVRMRFSGAGFPEVTGWF